MGMVEELLSQTRHNPGLRMLSQIMKSKIFDVRLFQAGLERLPAVMDFAAAGFSDDRALPSGERSRNFLRAARATEFNGTT